MTDDEKQQERDDLEEEEEEETTFIRLISKDNPMWKNRQNGFVPLDENFNPIEEQAKYWGISDDVIICNYCNGNILKMKDFDGFIPCLFIQHGNEKPRLYDCYCMDCVKRNFPNVEIKKDKVLSENQQKEELLTSILNKVKSNELKEILRNHYLDFITKSTLIPTQLTNFYNNMATKYLDSIGKIPNEDNLFEMLSIDVIKSNLMKIRSINKEFMTQITSILVQMDEFMALGKINLKEEFLKMIKEIFGG